MKVVKFLIATRRSHGKKRNLKSDMWTSDFVVKFWHMLLWSGGQRQQAAHFNVRLGTKVCLLTYNESNADHTKCRNGSTSGSAPIQLMVQSEVRIGEYRLLIPIDKNSVCFTQLKFAIEWLSLYSIPFTTVSFCIYSRSAVSVFDEYSSSLAGTSRTSIISFLWI